MQKRKQEGLMEDFEHETKKTLLFFFVFSSGNRWLVPEFHCGNEQRGAGRGGGGVRLSYSGNGGAGEALGL